jgi:predicted secreted protein
MPNPRIGNNLTLWKLDATEGIIPYACSRNVSLNVNLALREVTNYESNAWQEFKEDLMSWGLSIDGLVINENYSYWKQLRDQKNRQRFFFQFIVDEGASGFYVISGYCYITNITMNGPMKDVATYSATLQGTGSYSVTDTPLNPSGGSMTYKAAYSATGGESSFVVTDLINCNALLYASRGGVDSTANPGQTESIIETGTPTGGQFKIDRTTGTIYIDNTNPAVPGEWFNFLFR